MFTVIVLTTTHALTHRFNATRLHLLKVCYYLCLPFEWTPALWTAENIEYTNIPGSIWITQSPWIFCLFLIHSNIKTKYTWSDCVLLPVIRRLWQMDTTFFTGRQSGGSWRKHTCKRECNVSTNNISAKSFWNGHGLMKCTNLDNRGQLSTTL